jgi:cytoskeletal protein CcmA (bactofilin family)
MSERANESVLGPDAIFKGELSVSGPIRILGRFEGTLNGAPELLVGPEADVRANVSADVVTVEGKVQGDITARTRLLLGPRAHVEGDITSASLTVADGATFVGRVSVGAEPAPRKPAVQVVPGPIPPQQVVLPRAVVKVSSEWAGEPAPAAAPGDWLTQPIVKTPGWVKSATGAD